MGQLIGEINPEWAAWVSEVHQYHNVWQFNRYNAEGIQGDVPLARLGGLAVLFDSNIVSTHEDYERMEEFGVVNLAFEELGLVTTTSDLLAAAKEKHLGDTDIVKALNERSKPNDELGHRGFERWVFPLRSLALHSVATVESE